MLFLCQRDVFLSQKKDNNTRHKKQIHVTFAVIQFGLSSLKGKCSELCHHNSEKYVK